jgi:hypothetical protein
LVPFRTGTNPHQNPLFRMEYRPTTLEKAFQLARCGTCLNVDYLVKKLKAEKFDADQIQGKALRKQLLEISKKKHGTDWRVYLFLMEIVPQVPFQK